MKVLYGYSEEPRYFDFEKTKSVFITGAHSVGKSTLIHFLLFNIFTKSENRNIKLTLCDANKIEFGNYKNIPCVENILTTSFELIDFIESFDASKFEPDEYHFIVIDDLDFFDFKNFPQESCESFFKMIKSINSTKNVRIIVGCSFIYSCRNYIDLGTYFQSKLLFLFSDFEDLKIAGGFEIPPKLNLNEFIAFVNNECFYPVTYKDINDKEIETATTKISIIKFKEYEQKRLKAMQK